MRERNARRVKKDNTMFENITLLKKELDEAVNKPYIWELLNVAKEYKSNVEDFSLQKIENSLRLRNNEMCSEWFARKVDDLKREKNKKNCSSLFGEIRAIDNCYSVWYNKLLPSQKDEGPDFLAEDGVSWIIEVNTPSEAADAKSEIEKKCKSQRSPINFEIQEICPFGTPPNSRKDKHDNVQGEAVSKIAQIKQDEHQFKEDKINVLYVDLLDPIAFPLNIMDEQYSPLIAGNNGFFTSGAIWWAMYGKKRDPIWCEYAGWWGARLPYIMEFNGKLNKKSKIDFVVFSLPSKTIVFQNPYRKIPPKAILTMTKWNDFSLNESWLDVGFGCFRKKIVLKKLEIHRFIKAMEKNK